MVGRWWRAPTVARLLRQQREEALGDAVHRCLSAALALERLERCLKARIAALDDLERKLRALKRT